MDSKRYASAARACQHRRADNIDDELERVVLGHPLAVSLSLIAALYLIIHVLGYITLGIVPGWMR